MQTGAWPGHSARARRQYGRHSRPLGPSKQPAPRSQSLWTLQVENQVCVPGQQAGQFAAAGERVAGVLGPAAAGLPQRIAADRRRRPGVRGRRGHAGAPARTGQHLADRVLAGAGGGDRVAIRPAAGALRAGEAAVARAAVRRAQAGRVFNARTRQQALPAVLRERVAGLAGLQTADLLDRIAGRGGRFGRPAVRRAAADPRGCHRRPMTAVSELPASNDPEPPPPPLPPLPPPPPATGAPPRPPRARACHPSRHTPPCHRRSRRRAATGRPVDRADHGDAIAGAGAAAPAVVGGGGQLVVAGDVGEEAGGTGRRPPAAAPGCPAGDPAGRRRSGRRRRRPRW